MKLHSSVTRSFVRMAGCSTLMKHPLAQDKSVIYVSWYQCLNLLYVAWMDFYSCSVILCHADILLAMKLGFPPTTSKVLLPQLVCKHSADDCYQPLFNTYFLFHEFTDQHKGKFCNLIPGNYNPFLHIASLPLWNFPCIHLA